MRELLQGLLEERARETGEYQKLAQEASERGYTAEDKQELERRNKSLDELDSRIQVLKDRLVGDKQADEMRASVEGLLRPQVEDRKDGRNTPEDRQLLEFFKGGPGNAGQRAFELSFKGLDISQRDSRGVPIVREVRSGLDVGTGSAGGDLFAPTFRSVLYQHLIFNSAIRRTRATVLTTSSGENLLLPKTLTHPASATIVGEAAVINQNDPTFGQGTLVAYKYANLELVSTELEQDTEVDLLGYLAMANGRALGNGSGAHFVTGTGSSQPKGVITAGSAVVTGGTPASSGATFAELTQVYDGIIPPYQMNAEWLMSQSAMQKIRGLVNSQGTPIFLPTLYQDGPDTLFGKPIVLDPNVPTPASNATSLAFGDFAAYFIRDVNGVRFERSIDYAFNTDQVAYRAILRTGGDLLDLTGAIGTYVGGTA